MSEPRLVSLYISFPVGISTYTWDNNPNWKYLLNDTSPLTVLGMILILDDLSSASMVNSSV